MSRDIDLSRPCGLNKLTIIHWEEMHQHFQNLILTLGNEKDPSCEGQIIQPTLPSALPSFQLWRQEVNTDIVSPRLPERKKWEQISFNWSNCDSEVAGLTFLTPGESSPSAPQQALADVGWNLQPLRSSAIVSQTNTKANFPQGSKRNQLHKLRNFICYVTKYLSILPFMWNQELWKDLFPPRNSTLHVIARK